MRNRLDVRNLASYLAVVLFLAISGSVHGTINVVSQITEVLIISFEDTPSVAMSDEKVEYGIDGYVVYSTPADACAPVPIPPQYPEEVNWILLAKHTPATPDCSFANKTRYAFDSGYTGIIVHNVGSNSTDDFDEAVDTSDTIIYATFIGEYHGQLLRDNFSYPRDKYFKTFVRIRHDESVTNQWLVYLVAFLVILCFCALLVVPILMLWNSALTCLDKIRRIRRRKLRVAIINKFPINEWAEGDPQQSCVICLDDFEPHDRVRILPCSHGFHATCIDPWLQKCKKFCPICKRKVIVLNENVETAASDSDDETTPLLHREPSTSAVNPSINSPSMATASSSTFSQQAENPFRRAIRLARRAASRQRLRQDQEGQDATLIAPIDATVSISEPALPPTSTSTSNSIPFPSSNGFESLGRSISSASSSSDSGDGDVTNVVARTYQRQRQGQRELTPEVTVIVNPRLSADAQSSANDQRT